MFLTLKSKSLIITVCTLFGILCLFYICFCSLITTKTNVSIPTIVIDAGHGGIDGGCVGKSGVTEKEINLIYAKKLRQYCLDYGMRVIMTRSNDNGLYSIFAQNKKKDDMKNRKKIIEDSNADLVVSIHMNSFPVVSCRGAQVFYDEENSNGKVLAENVQSQFVKNLTKSRQIAKSADYFMVKCTVKPAILVECGYLSNQEEEKLLLSNEYCDLICYSILCGIYSYFSI